MHATRPSPVTSGRFSPRRTAITACVLSAHFLLGLLLLAPATPRRGVTASDARDTAHDDSLILVFVHPAAPPARRRTPRLRATRRLPSPARRPRAHVVHAGHSVTTQRQPIHAVTPQAASTPASGAPSDVPEYVPGGRTFHQALRDVRRRQARRYLPEHHVPGMPRFAMRDPASAGVAGALHVLTNALGAQDPACVQAGTEMTMSDAELAQRHMDRADVQQTIDEHRCVLRPASWMAPQGPATHLHARPPGHGMQ